MSTTLGILFLKLFWLTVSKNCSSDLEQLFENRKYEGPKFAYFEIPRIIHSNDERSVCFLKQEKFEK